MNDTLFVVRTMIRHLAGYPIAVVQDFLWFKLNYRPAWLRRSRQKFFDRMDADRIRMNHVVSRFRFWLKRSKDAKS